MKKHILSLMLMAGLGASVPALATPFVTTGSQYSFYLQGDQSGNPLTASVIFDNNAAITDRGGLTLTVSESQTAVSATQDSVTINIMADGDLFPVLGETGIFGIGTDGNGLDFSELVNLDDATVTFTYADGSTQDFTGAAGLADNNFPWDGTFAGPDDAIGLPGIGGTGIYGITYNFLISSQTPSGDVPEPGSLLLCGIGLLAGTAAMRRRAGR